MDFVNDVNVSSVFKLNTSHTFGSLLIFQRILDVQTGSTTESCQIPLTSLHLYNPNFY